jgi:hypothetical protein
VSTGASIARDEFFFQGSLLTLQAHFTKHSDFPKKSFHYGVIFRHCLNG